MNTQKIRFTVNGQEKEIEVQGCYPYLTNSETGKVVLKITANEDDATFSDLHALKDNESGLIELYARAIDGEVVGEWELKANYDNYNSGEVVIGYRDGVYTCDVTRIGEYERKVLQNEADIQYVALMADIPLV